MNNGTSDIKKSVKTDQYEHHDYYNVDDLLNEDHILARDAVRDWVKKEVSPIIEDYSNRAACPTHLFKGLADWSLWPKSSCRIWWWRNG